MNGLTLPVDLFSRALDQFSSGGERRGNRQPNPDMERASTRQKSWLRLARLCAAYERCAAVHTANAARDDAG
jgi:hypothetical protein